MAKKESKKDPYAQRKHRVKYQVGYGCEGAARGENELPPDGSESPKEQSWEDADNEAYLRKQRSKTRPNPY